MRRELSRSGLFFAISFLQALDNQLVPVLQPALRAEMGTGPAWALMLVYPIACGTIPFLATRKGRTDQVRSLALTALIVLAAAALAFASTTSAPIRLLARAAAGGASGVLSMTLLLGAARIEDDVSRARQFAVITAGQLAGVAIGIPLATNFEVAPAYLAIGGGGLLLSLFFGVFPHGPAGDSPPARLPFRELIKDRVPALILLATGVAGIVLAAPVGSLSSFLASERQFSQARIGAVYMWAGVGPLLAMIIAGRTIARWSPRTIAIAGSILVAIPIGLFPELAISFAAAASVMLACCFIETLRRASLQGALADVVRPGDLPKYLAYRGVILQLGTAVGYAVAGIRFAIVCAIAAGLSIVTALILVGARRPSSLAVKPVFHHGDHGESRRERDTEYRQG